MKVIKKKLVKKIRPLCLRGKRHGPDEWKLAQVIIDQKLLVVNMSIGLKCALNDIKKSKIK